MHLRRHSRNCFRVSVVCCMLLLLVLSLLLYASQEGSMYATYARRTYVCMYVSLQRHLMVSLGGTQLLATAFLKAGESIKRVLSWIYIKIEYTRICICTYVIVYNFILPHMQMCLTHLISSTSEKYKKKTKKKILKISTKAYNPRFNIITTLPFPLPRPFP